MPLRSTVQTERQAQGDPVVSWDDWSQCLRLFPGGAKLGRTCAPITRIFGRTAEEAMKMMTQFCEKFVRKWSGVVRNSGEEAIEA